MIPKTPYKDIETDFQIACPECGGRIIHQEGCALCRYCGHSSC